ncbi:MAG: hypothetical protein V4596_04240 [Bdellovibrionota bacterium]
MKQLLFFALVALHNISALSTAHAQYTDFADIKEEMTIQAESASAAREKAIQESLEKVVARFTVDLVGEKKYEASKNILNAQTAKEAGKFAPVIKADILEQNGNKFKVSVDMKVSPQNLRQMLEKTGILTSQFDSGVVLPFVTYVDQVRAKTYKWWVSEPLNDDTLRNVNKYFNTELRKSLKSLNFYVLDPIDWNFRNSLPMQFQKDYFKKEDYQSMESYFKFPLAIKGQVDIAPSQRVSTSYKIQVKLEAILTSQGKVVAESSRQLETESGDLSSILQKNAPKIFSEVSNDLKDQLEGALRKGILESSMIQIAVRGDMSFKNLENFKSTLLKSIGSIRYLSERSIESDKRIFDVDYAGSILDLTKRIQALKFQGFNVTTSGAARTIDVTIKD